MCKPLVPSSFSSSSFSIVVIFQENHVNYQFETYEYKFLIGWLDIHAISDKYVDIVHYLLS